MKATTLIGFFKWRSRLRVAFGILLGVSLGLVLAGLLLSFERARVCHVPILMYHKIGSDADTPWWVTPEDFESQLQCLREQGYRSVLPSDLAAHQSWGKPLPHKAVILTFDDGYLNTVETAEPLLKKYGFRGTCYLITGQVADTPETRRRYEGAPMLIWPEVRAAAERGTLRFGGHTRSHVNLRAADDASAAAEAAGCFEDLRRKGRLKPAGFCYPFGQYHTRTPALVKAAGFTTAVTCEDGVAAAGAGLNAFELPRVSVMGGTHRYHAERVDTTNTVAVRVWKEGHSMKVHPLWHSPDGTETWGSPAKIAADPVVLQSPTNFPAPSTWELWDDFRVLRLFRQSL